MGDLGDVVDLGDLKDTEAAGDAVSPQTRRGTNRSWLRLSCATSWTCSSPCSSTVKRTSHTASLAGAVPQSDGRCVPGAKRSVERHATHEKGSSDGLFLSPTSASSPPALSTRSELGFFCFA